MKPSNIISKRELKSGLIFALFGLLIGWLMFRESSSSDIIEMQAESHLHDDNSEYTCSMHPQIRQDKSGSCPICGMDLIPLENDRENENTEVDYTVKLSESAMKIAEVTTSKVVRKIPTKELFLSGKVKVDERRISKLTARFSGRIENLFVNYTGQKVKKGDVLARIYSPELITAQKELLEAAKYKSTNYSYYAASRKKLMLWNLSKDQLSSIEKSGKVEFYFDIHSPLSGTVTLRNTSLGEYVREGTTLFEITDLSKLWVVFDAYEDDLSWIRLKDRIDFTIPSIPNETFESIVKFIDPLLNAKTRVAGIRTEISNKNDYLKPEMLVTGRVHVEPNDQVEMLLIPKSAILWTGKRAVVYVKVNDDKNLFQYREVGLGADAGDYYIVLNGLAENELVATNGVFKIDAAAQLKGSESMMNASYSKNNEETDFGVSGEFKKQIGGVFENYLELINSFVMTDVVKAAANAEIVEVELARVDMSLVNNLSPQQERFMNVMRAEIAKIKGSKDIEEQRASLLPLSESLYGIIKYFSIDNIEAYYQFCPMAENGQGAYWLSSTAKIENPYFGDRMLSCGETKEVINKP